MTSLNNKYLQINRKIIKLKTHIKFLINNYTFHNEKDPRVIMKEYESYLNEIQLCYDGFVKNCETFENVTTEAEQLSIYFDQEIKKCMEKLNLGLEDIGAIDEDLAFLDEEPTVLAQSEILNTSSDNLHGQEDINISGMQYMNDSMESPDDTIFVSKNNPTAGLATPMVKSNKKKSLRPKMLMRNIQNV